MNARAARGRPGTIRVGSEVAECLLAAPKPRLSGRHGRETDLTGGSLRPPPDPSALETASNPGRYVWTLALYSLGVALLAGSVVLWTEPFDWWFVID